MFSPDIQDKIDAYLAGALPPEDIRAFEAAMKGDPELREAVELHAALDLLEQQRFESNMAQWRGDMDTLPPPPGPSSFWNRNIRLLLFGAGALLLVAGAFWFFRPEPPQPPVPQPQVSKPSAPVAVVPDNTTIPAPPAEKPGGATPSTPGTTPSQRSELVALATKNLNQRYDLASTSDLRMGAGDETTSSGAQLALADKALAAKNFRKAEKLLRALLHDEPDNPKAMERLAWALFKQNRAAEAVSWYEQFAQKTKDKDLADWYLAQYYLADLANRGPAYRQLMQKMMNDTGHRFHTEAVRLNGEVEVLRSKK